MGNISGLSACSSVKETPSFPAESKQMDSLFVQGSQFELNLPCVNTVLAQFN